MKIYKHIFFDLDHTLWDFEKNCAQTLEELYHFYGFSRLQFSVNDLIEKYNLINHQMWHDFHRGKIDKIQIRNTRFERTFAELGIASKEVPDGINEKFLEICPAKGNLMPYTFDVLDYLSQNYLLHIITNGFKDTQSVKIATSKLDKYFKEVINSEICGFSKPDAKIFHYAMNKVNADPQDCIMIGDDLFTDILGARNVNIDHVYFNPKEAKHNEQVTYEIKSLLELKIIL